jgi:hypothetical protein
VTPDHGDWSSGAWPIPAFQKPGFFANLGKSSSEIVGLERMRWLIFKLTCRGIKNAGNSL